MSAESQSLENLFKNMKDVEGLPGDFDSTETELRDFESFFEKLSSFDDLKWYEEEPSAAGDGSSSRKPDPSAADSNARGARRSSRPKSLNAKIPSRTAPQAGLEPGGWDTMGSNTPAPANRVVKALVKTCKLSLIALVLFGTGLGAGLLALSLPQRFNGLDMAAKKEGDLQKTAEHSAVSPIQMQETTKSTEAMPVITSQGDSRGTKRSSDRIVKKMARSPQEKIAVGKVPQKPKGLRITQNGNPVSDASITPPGPASIAVKTGTSRQPTSRMTLPARQPSTKPAAQSKAVKKSIVPTTASPTQGKNPRYSLQVGACQSLKCVRSYRKILQSHVDPESIQVVETSSAPGQEAIRRIRIKPLSRQSAQSLQERLVAADARFRGAYLINVH